MDRLSLHDHFLVVQLGQLLKQYFVSNTKCSYCSNIISRLPTLATYATLYTRVLFLYHGTLRQRKERRESGAQPSWFSRISPYQQLGENALLFHTTHPQGLSPKLADDGPQHVSLIWYHNRFLGTDRCELHPVVHQCHRHLDLTCMILKRPELPQAGKRPRVTIQRFDVRLQRAGDNTRDATGAYTMLILYGTQHCGQRTSLCSIVSSSYFPGYHPCIRLAGTWA